MKRTLFRLARRYAELVCAAVGHRPVRHVAQSGGGPSEGETWTDCDRCGKVWGP